MAQLESTCNEGDLGSIPGLGRSRGEGHGNPLQYSGLENPMDCIVHGVAKSWTQLRDFHFHLFIYFWPCWVCVVVWAFLKQGLLSSCGAWASYCSGFSCGAQDLGHVGSAVAAPGLWSTGSAVVSHGLSCPVACGSSQTSDQTRVSRIDRQILYP